MLSQKTAMSSFLVSFFFVNPGRLKHLSNTGLNRSSHFLCSGRSFPTSPSLVVWRNAVGVAISCDGVGLLVVKRATSDE